MPPGAFLVAAACFAAAAFSLYFLVRFAWVRTARATILAFALLLAFTYWQAGRAEGMQALALVATATLMILPALVGGLAGAFLGGRRQHVPGSDGRV
jgi:hypothetical protein